MKFLIAGVLVPALFVAENEDIGRLVRETGVAFVLAIASRNTRRISSSRLVTAGVPGAGALVFALVLSSSPAG